ncbi:MAG: hypothetical protein IT245_04680 [Bacteroidia bacterium]|nr:hypothetical protein [Bacteroidia bacterium]
MDRKSQIINMLELNPSDVFLRYALAMELVSENLTSQAIDSLVQIKISNPEYLPIYYQLGKLYESQNLNDLAIESYEQGMELAALNNEAKTLSELKSALEELTF